MLILTLNIQDGVGNHLVLLDKVIIHMQSMNCFTSPYTSKHVFKREDFIVPENSS
jgi:hypothetical protein